MLPFSPQPAPKAKQPAPAPLSIVRQLSGRDESGASAQSLGAMPAKAMVTVSAVRRSGLVSAADDAMLTTR